MPRPERTFHVAFEGFRPDDWAVVLELRRHLSNLQEEGIKALIEAILEGSSSGLFL